MKKSESGRSMVEMLGVLALVGILSVTGLYAYISAMRKHQTNEIVQTISMLVMLSQAANSGNGDCISLSSSNLQTTFSGINIDAIANSTIEGSPTEVLLQIKNADEDNLDVLCTSIQNTVSSDGSEYQIDCGDSEVSCQGRS